MTVTPDEVVWAYRILLGREPESQAVIKAQCNAYASLDELRRAFADTPEFHALAPMRKPVDSFGQFLIPPPQNGRIMIDEPTMERPASQLCTVSQMRERHHIEFCKKVGISAEVLHRKNWEWSYISRVLESVGMIKAGKRGLCFAVGTESLPAYFAAQGAAIMATDGPPEVAGEWSSSAQYAKDGLKSIHKQHLIDWETFASRVTFGIADMRSIPSNLRNFDFLWSSCSFEHLGSIRAGLDFVHDAMDCLVPGGIAVHTTEFNTSSNDDTIDGGPTSIFRKRDIDLLADELSARGHKVWPLNYFPGFERQDQHVDLPPYGFPHLKLLFSKYSITSIGIVVEKRA